LVIFGKVLVKVLVFFGNISKNNVPSLIDFLKSIKTKKTWNITTLKNCCIVAIPVFLHGGLTYRSLVCINELFSCWLLSLLLLLQFVIIARVMETYLDGKGFNTYGTGNQYPEVGYWILRGDTKLWILVSQLVPRKNINFRPYISFILLAFISRKVLELC
jgi:hypothetical protein